VEGDGAVLRAHFLSCLQMAIEVQLDDRDVVVLIMDYLKSRELITSMVALEEETGRQSEDLGKELGFLRKLVLAGDWEAALSFVKPLQTSAPSDHTRVVFAVKKQQFLELLESKDSRPELPELVNVLKGIESLCSGAEFKELCFFLTLSDIREHGDFRSWTATRGRYATFQAMLTVLHPLYGAASTDSKAAGTREDKSRLVQLLERAVLQQALTVKQRNGEPALNAEGLDEVHTIALPLMHDVTAGDISGEKMVSRSKGRGAGGSAGAASSMRSRAVHASLDLSQTQRLPDMRVLSKSAARERKGPAKEPEAMASSSALTVLKSPSKSSPKASELSAAATGAGNPAEDDVARNGPDLIEEEYDDDEQDDDAGPALSVRPLPAAGINGEDDSEDNAEPGHSPSRQSDSESEEGCDAPGNAPVAGKPAESAGAGGGGVCIGDFGKENGDSGGQDKDDETQDWKNSLRHHADEHEPEPVRKPVAWTIGFDPQDSDARGSERRGSSVQALRGSREMPVLSASRKRAASAAAHGEVGGGSSGVATGRRSGCLASALGKGAGKKNVSTVGRNGEAFGKTVKITHEFDKDGGLAVSADSEEEGTGAVGVSGAKKGLAWVAGIDLTPANTRPRPASVRSSLRSSAGSAGGGGGLSGVKGAQARAATGSNGHGGSNGKEDALRRSRDQDEGTSRGVRKAGAGSQSHSMISDDMRRSPGKDERGSAYAGRGVGGDGGAGAGSEWWAEDRDESAIGGGGVYAEAYVDDADAREQPASVVAADSPHREACVNIDRDLARMRDREERVSSKGSDDDMYHRSGFGAATRDADIGGGSARDTGVAGGSRAGLDGPVSRNVTNSPGSRNGARSTGAAASHGATGPASSESIGAGQSKLRGEGGSGVEGPGASGYAGGVLVPLALQAVDVLQDTQVIRTVAWCPDSRSKLLAYGTTSRALRFAEASEARGVRVIYEVSAPSRAPLRFLHHVSSIWHTRHLLLDRALAGLVCRTEM
jgi:hypothetical protein